MTVESARLTIKCEPEINAKVILNGEDTGRTTPVNFTLVKGEYTIELKMQPAYVISEWLADGVSISKEQKLTLSLQRDTVLTARVMVNQQTQILSTMMSLAIMVVILLIMGSVIKELVGAVGGL